MPNPNLNFTPSASATYPVSAFPALIALPSLDGSNPALLLKNTGGAPLAVVAGSPAGPVGQAPNAVVLTPGASVLVTDPGLLGGTVATVAATTSGNGTLLAMRGTAAAAWTFPAPGVFVI
jgi:hypothetical protein